MFPVQTKRMCFKVSTAREGKVIHHAEYSSQRLLKAGGNFFLQTKDGRPGILLLMENRCLRGAFRAATLKSVEPLDLPENFIGELYRFAVLMTADHAIAARALMETFAEAPGELAQFRHDRNRETWLVSKVRDRCLRGAKMPADRAEADGAVPEIARQFHLMSEPARSAAALFYLDLLSAEEIAQLLSLSLEEFSDGLTRARGVLRQSTAMATE